MCLKNHIGGKSTLVNTINRPIIAKGIATIFSSNNPKIVK